MVSTSFSALQLNRAVYLGLVALSFSLVFAGEVERRDGSTITVSTTQFNPAITNQGGTTNAAGTFNVSPLATSTSYQFQTLSQTSTFQPGPVATQAAPNSGSSAGNSAGGSAGNTGGINANIGPGTVVVTATAPTSTVNMTSGIANTTSTSASTSGTGSTGGIALGSNSINAASSPRFAPNSITTAWLAVIASVIATLFAAAIIL